jgi:hypothetical protein
MNDMLKKVNNDTVVLIVLAIVACIYAASGTGDQIVNSITSGMIGYITRANNQ